MKNLKFAFFAIVMSVCFVSCATVSITSKSSDKLKGPYTKIFILVNRTARARGFIHGVDSVIEKEFAKRNIAVQIYVKGDLSLDTDKDINQKISDYQPDAVLVMNQTESVLAYGIAYDGNEGEIEITLDIKLLDVTGQDILWRANMKASANMGIETASDKASKNLIAKLETDNIISKMPVKK
jgi:hypothetical protein